MKATLRLATVALCIVAASIGSFVSAWDIVYANADKVNVRKSPSTNAPVVNKLSKYQVVNIDMDVDPVSGWVALYDEEDYTKNGYVKSTLLTVVESTDFSLPADGLTFSLLTADPNLSGYLTLEPNGKGFEGFMRIINAEWQSQGGSGTVYAGDVKGGIYNGEAYYVDTDGREMLMPYDAKSGILVLDGMLWQRD